MPDKLRVLLTGGCGCIGSHTAVELMRTGHEVVIAGDIPEMYADPQGCEK